MSDVECRSPANSPAGAKRAVILAAGAGRRLGSFTERHPKPLLEIGGVPILINCLHRLEASGIVHVVIVVGHLKEQIQERIGAHFGQMRIDYVVSERYATTNNVYSLWCAREYLNEDVLLLEADIFFDPGLIEALQKTEGEVVVAVDDYKPGMDGTVVRLDDSGFLTELVEGARQGPGFDYRDTYKTVNFYRFGKRFLEEDFVPSLDRTIGAGETGCYYELLLKQTIAEDRFRLAALNCRTFRWYEVDDAQDRRAAEYMFLSPEAKLKFLGGQYGSYWRYGVVDHSYLYNLSFPPSDMWKRLSRDMEQLAKQYPVGQAAMADLLSDVVDHAPARLVVANGASELIRIMCGRLGHRIIVPVPSFNEYENATEADALVRVGMEPPDFALDVDAFARQAVAQACTMAVVVSPNNPTAAVVPKRDLVRLCAALDAAGILLLLDESFVDFCEDPEAQSLEDLLDRHANLVILKSMSKVYGIGGLRLGYLLSGNDGVLSAVRAQLPIWNINGFAEGVMRLLPRYRREFRESCREVLRHSREFAERLRRIPGVHVSDPDANFVFLRLPQGWNSEHVAWRFFDEHDILVKHCAQKSMPDGTRYLRVSTRSPDENRRFADILSEILNSQSR